MTLTRGTDTRSERVVGRLRLDVSESEDRHETLTRAGERRHLRGRLDTSTGNPLSRSISDLSMNVQYFFSARPGVLENNAITDLIDLLQVENTSFQESPILIGREFRWSDYFSLSDALPTVHHWPEEDEGSPSDEWNYSPVHGTDGSPSAADHIEALLDTLGGLDSESVERLRELADMEPNWDGYGGLPSTSQAVQAASELLLQVHRLDGGGLASPLIGPMPDGGLELEWRLESGRELMLGIPEDASITEFLITEVMESGDKVDTEGALPDDATLTDLIQRLSR